jgi:Ca-activated chloride channel homolog
MNSFLLDDKTWFWLLLILPAFWLLFWLRYYWQRRAQNRFADKELLKKLAPNQSFFKAVLKAFVLSLAIFFLVVALVNPKIGTKLETIKREGVDVVFAVDVSKSMLAEDIAPNRLEKSKQLVTQIINNLASDRIGIIAYAGKAFPQLPITTDYAAGKIFLNNLNTDMLSSQGTAIHEAIELSKTFYNNAEQTNRVLIILSDGEDHGENALVAAAAAKEEGIKIFTIGVGTEKGKPIPIKRNGVVQNYKKDKNGETVITKLDETTLMQIASQTDGIYLRGDSTAQVVEAISAQFDKMDKTEFEAKQIADFKDQFQWFLGIGLFFLFVDMFLLERKTAWLKKLNLFNENF